MVRVSKLGAHVEVRRVVLSQKGIARKQNSLMTASHYLLEHEFCDIHARRPRNIRELSQKCLLELERLLNRPSARSHGYGLK